MLVNVNYPRLKPGCPGGQNLKDIKKEFIQKINKRIIECA